MKVFARKTFVLFLSCAITLSVFGQQVDRDTSSAYAIAQSQSALEIGDFKKALAVIQEALKSLPEDGMLRLQLARIYVYQHRDKQALLVLEDVVRKDPSNRKAALELAQTLGYHGDYKRSDQMYRQMLAANANDEPAAIGLVRNLIHEGRRDEAHRELRQALERHPDNLVLLRYEDYLAGAEKAGLERRVNDAGKFEMGEYYFSDTAGNRVFRSAQAFSYRVDSRLASRLRLEERSLWKAGTAQANVSSGVEDVQLRINRFLSATAEGGAVRFADDRSRSLYAGDLQLHPFKVLTLSGGYSRFPVCPTFDSTQFNLLGQGWHGGLDLRSKNFFLIGGYSRSHYSDGNRAERENAEILRWIGIPSFAFGTGYSFTHLHFTQSFHHGYFDPSEYRSHLAEAGFRFRIKNVFRGDYLGLAGIESVANGTYNPAGEVLLRNHFLLGRWDLELSYSRYQVAQSTGAFQANSGSVVLGYHF